MDSNLPAALSSRDSSPEKIKIQEKIIEDLKISSKCSEQRYEELLHQERERVASLRTAFRSGSESSAAAFEDMKQNIETLRYQLDRKRERITKLEQELGESQAMIEGRLPDTDPDTALYAQVEALRCDLENEKALVVDLRYQLDLVKIESQSTPKTTVEFVKNTPRTIENRLPESAGSGKSVESQRYGKEFVDMILMTEKANIDKLQGELRKHLETGSSSM